MTMQQVNLYHPVFRKQQKRFSAKAMVQAGVGVLLGTVLMYGYAHWQTFSLRNQVTQAAEELEQARKRLATLNQQIEARHADTRLAQELRDLESRLAAAEGIGSMIAGEARANSDGYSKYFAAFARQHVAGVWLTGFSVIGDDITLNGRTVDPQLVPHFLQRLSQEQALSGARFQVFQMQRPERDAKGNAKNTAYVDFVIKTADHREPDKMAKKP